MTCAKVIYNSALYWPANAGAASMNTSKSGQASTCSNSRPPTVGSRHHPLRMDEGASTEVMFQVAEGCLILNGIGGDLCTSDDSVPL